jgi:hypothetical protein
LKAKGLINNSKPRAIPEFSVSQLGNDIQRDQGINGGDLGAIQLIGKRQHQESANGDHLLEGDEVVKRHNI